MGITDLCLRRPVFAWMLMFATIMFGLIALGIVPGATAIGVSQFPDVNNPTVSVSVSWPGGSPEDIETGLINPLEDVLAQVTGVTEMTSSAKQGSARVSVSFDIDRDIDLAVQDVQAKVAQIQKQLPTGVQPPTVSKSNPDDTPIITIGVSGENASPRLLADIARYQVMDALTTLDGVGQIQLSGNRDRAIRVWLHAQALISHGITVTDVQNAIKQQHVTASGGQMVNGQRAIDIRVLGEVVDPKELANLVVKKTGTQITRLSDVAGVEDGFEDETSRAHMVWRDQDTHAPYKEAVQAMGVLKAPGSNAVAVAANVRAQLAEIQKTLPEGVHLNVLFDTTGFIKESVSEIGLELVLAVILTAIVCWLFLGSLSSTLNVLFAIPMSLLGTVAVLYFLHWTLNTFTLLGLSLAVGLVVDDAVMVMENIYRHGEMGKSKLEASRDGTKEITFAALAATIAVIAIFLPVAFMSGVIGKYFLQFGVTLSVAVLISYLEAITLAPARCAQMLKIVPHDQKGLVARVGDKLFAMLERTYSRVLAIALRAPVIVLLLAVGVLVGSYFAFAQLQREMVPSQDQARLAVRLTMPTGSDLDTSDRLTHAAEEVLMRHPELDHLQTTVNVGGASMSLTMVEANQRKMTQLDFMNIIRKELTTIPGVRGSVQDLSQQGFGGGRGKPVEISVRGGDWTQLIGFSQKVQQELEDSGLAADLDSDYTLGPPELAISPDRPSASDVGVNVSDIATTVSALIGGATIGQFSAAGRRMNIEMRMESTYRARPEDLDLVRVRATSGTMVPLSAVTKHAEVPELQSINHANRQRAIRLSGNVGPGHAQSEVLAYVQGTLQKEAPPGFALVLSGQSSQFGDAMSSLGFALIVGIIFAYMVLASQFNSVMHPITVLTILPLSLAGAMVALYVCGKTLNVYSMIGLLLLMGIVKKNSIILVDYANEVKEKDNLSAIDAMKKAGPVRLRPILMTAIATAMAAVPSAMGLGPGAETRGPMADAIIGGLIVSTVLSLFVVPAFYVVVDRFTKKKVPTATATAVPPAAH